MSTNYFLNTTVVNVSKLGSEPFTSKTQMRGVMLTV